MGLNIISEDFFSLLFFHRLTACLFSIEDSARQIQRRKKKSLILKVEKFTNDGFAVAKRKQSLDLTKGKEKIVYSVLHNFSIIGILRII